jgi:hypothetical protein
MKARVDIRHEASEEVIVAATKAVCERQWPEHEWPGFFGEKDLTWQMMRGHVETALRAAYAVDFVHPEHGRGDDPASPPVPLKCEKCGSVNLELDGWDIDKCRDCGHWRYR